jgi:hypothetical protein
MFPLQGLLLQMIISYLESASTSLGYGLGLAAAVLAGELVRATSFSAVMCFGAQTGNRRLYKLTYQICA